MPTLTIDGQQITVPEGTNVLEAARGVDIVIPHFCYHEALGAVGACRLCAMTFLEGPVKGIQMSCMVQAQDGMVVSTLEQGSVDLRKHVIEWLMMNHPHDCPVCDEGGECLLQDMTVAGGHTLRRYRGLKRTYDNQYLGPFVYQEMNRCIQCYRCVRTYQDYCGGTDFGVMGCNQRIYFGRFRDGTLESCFSGNIVDVCPTGVFTDKTFRYRARYWDLEEAPAVCPHCSLGCAIVPGARYRELQRVRAGVNRQTSGWFICDRGRFGYGHANHPKRPRRPRLDGREVGWGEAAAALRRRLAEIGEQHGAGSIAFLSSPRASLEANAQLKRLAGELGSDRLCFDPHPQHDRAARVLAAGLGRHARSLEEIRNSDCLVFIGADPLNEGPGLALAARQAVRRGASAAAFDPRPVQLPFPAVHLPLEPQRLPASLKALVSGDTAAFGRQQATVLAGVIAHLRQAKRPVLLGGVDLLGPSGVQALLAAAEALDSPERPCGAAVLLGGPNSFGGALQAGEGPDMDDLLADIEAGRIRALVCLEADPFADHPEPLRATRTLGRLELLAAFDYLPTETVRRAQLFLPTAVPAESAGTYANNEGRMLPFASVFDPGTPLRVTGAGEHPPRSFFPLTPGSEPRPSWAALAAVREEEISLGRVRACIEENNPRLAGLRNLQPYGTGQRVADGSAAAAKMAEAAADDGDALRLLAVASLFGSEAIAACSPVLDPVRPSPHLLMQVDDAAHLGLVAGDRVRLTTGSTEATAVLELSPVLPPGLVIVPRLRGTPLEIFVPGGALHPCRVEKEEGP